MDILRLGMQFLHTPQNRPLDNSTDNSKGLTSKPHLPKLNPPRNLQEVVIIRYSYPLAILIVAASMYGPIIQIGRGISEFVR